MGILKRLFKKRSRGNVIIGGESVTEAALNAFLKADSVEEIEKVLRRYPELVTTAGALRTIESIIESLRRGDHDAPEDEAAALRKHFEVKRDILRTVRDTLE